MSGTQATEHTIADAENDAHAARLRAGGMTYRQIAAQEGCSLTTAHRRVQRALKAVPVEAVEELRGVERERLDELWRFARIELGRNAPVVQHGKIVRDADGEPVVDWGAKLAAAGMLVRIMERRARLEGLDAPTRAKVDVTYETVLDTQLRELIDEMAGGNGDPTGGSLGPVVESPAPVAVGDGTAPDGPPPESGDPPG